MSYYGNGGYPFMTVYNMPVWMRNLHFNFIAKAKEEEEKQNKKIQNGTTGGTKSISIPSHLRKDIH